MKRKIREFIPSSTKEILVYDEEEEFMKVVGEGDYMEDKDGCYWCFDDNCVFLLQK